MIVYGHHRSAALADRHARKIERDNDLPNGAVSWTRRNASGRFSNRGQFFIFVFEEGISEYSLRAEYDGKAQRGGRHPIDLEFHFFAPRGLQEEAALDAIEHWALMGNLPPRWVAPVAITCRGKVYEKPGDVSNLRYALYKIFEEADIFFEPVPKAKKESKDSNSGN